MYKVKDAHDEWRAAARDLAMTTPGTAQWLRAHMMEEERRLAYRAVTEAVEREMLADPAEHTGLDQAGGQTG